MPDRDGIVCRGRHCSVCSNTSTRYWDESRLGWVVGTPPTEGEMPTARPPPPWASPATPADAARTPDRVVFAGNGAWVYFPSGTPETWFMTESVQCGGCGRGFAIGGPVCICEPLLPRCATCGEAAYSNRRTNTITGRYAEAAWCEHLTAANYRGVAPPPLTGQLTFTIGGVPGVTFTASARITCPECGAGFRHGAHTDCQRRANDHNERLLRENPMSETYGLGMNCGQCGGVLVFSTPHGLNEERCNHAEQYIKIAPVERGKPRAKSVTLIATLTMALADDLRPSDVRRLATKELQKLLPPGRIGMNADHQNGQVLRITGANVRLVRSLGPRGQIRWQ